MAGRASVESGTDFLRMSEIQGGHCLSFLDKQGVTNVTGVHCVSRLHDLHNLPEGQHGTTPRLYCPDARRAEHR